MLSRIRLNALSGDKATVQNEWIRNRETGHEAFRDDESGMCSRFWRAEVDVKIGTNPNLALASNGSIRKIGFEH